MQRPPAAFRSSFPLALVLGLALPAAAQFPVHTLQGDHSGDNFGDSVAGIGDVDGDGFGDFIVGAPRHSGSSNQTGEVFVFSGLTGGVLHHIQGSDPTAQFGATVAGGGDLDGDGVPDFVVGAPWFQGIGPIQGKVVAFSGATGAVLWTVEGFQSFSLFGETLDTRGDVNGDGYDDVLVGAPNEDGNAANSGMVYVLSGIDGSVLQQHSGDSNNHQLGFSLSYCGDVNGDGVVDFVAGAPFFDQPFFQCGQVRVFSGATGAILHAINGLAASDFFGRSVAGIGDVNGDGRGDIAVGTWLTDVGGTNTGSVTILSGINGSVLATFHGSVANQGLGLSVTNIGDYTGNGRPELAVGVRDDVPGGSVRIWETIGWTEVGAVLGVAGEQIDSVAGGFDVNADGRSEFLVGRRQAGGGAGEAVVYSGVNLLGTAYCFGDGSGSPCPCGNASTAGRGCANSSGSGASLTGAGSPSVGADDLELRMAGLIPSQPALAFVALNATNNGQGLVFGDGLRCAGGGLVRLGIRIPDGAGQASWGPGLSTQGMWSSGDLRRFQGWYRDPQGSPCGLNFNLTNGYEVQFLP